MVTVRLLADPFRDKLGSRAGVSKDCDSSSRTIRPCVEGFGNLAAVGCHKEMLRGSAWWSFLLSALPRLLSCSIFSGRFQGFSWGGLSQIS